MNNYGWKLSALALVGVCLVFAAKVNTDYNKSTDFAQYRTYSWIGVKAGNSLWQDRIARDIDQQLAEKGWTKQPSGGDVGVAAMGTTHNEQSLETFYNGFGGGWYWRGFGDGMATTTVQNQPVGTLVVDMFDSHSKKLIWRGTATDALSDKPEKNEKKLENAVSELFKKFPPKTGG